MTFNPDDLAPPNQEYLVRDEESGSYGALGFILAIAAICLGLYFMLNNGPTSTASPIPNRIETTNAIVVPIRYNIR